MISTKDRITYLPFWRAMVLCSKSLVKVSMFTICQQQTRANGNFINVKTIILISLLCTVEKCTIPYFQLFKAKIDNKVIDCTDLKDS